jgi:hypothetical protein
VFSTVFGFSADPSVGIIVGSVAAIVGTAGLATPLAAIAIGASVADITFTITDAQEEITGDNFIKDNVFQGNELAYAGVGIAVGFVAPNPVSKGKAAIKTAGKVAKYGEKALDAAKAGTKNMDDVAKNAGKTIDPLTGREVGRFIVDPKGNVMIEPVGGSTVPTGRGGIDTHTLYPNESNYQRLNPTGHIEDSTPHAHGHLEGTGPNMDGQGTSIVSVKVRPEVICSKERR